MPQLDKVSFQTQYIWLTLFVFVIYWIVAEFFVPNCFVSFKLRNIISRNVDFEKSENTNISMINAISVKHLNEYIRKYNIVKGFKK